MTVEKEKWRKIHNNEKVSWHRVGREKERRRGKVIGAGHAFIPSDLLYSSNHNDRRRATERETREGEKREKEWDRNGGRPKKIGRVLRLNLWQRG